MRLNSAVTLASYGPGLPSWPYLILCLLSAAGCGPTFENRTPDFSLVPARLVVMPVLTRSVELDFEGHRSAKRDWAHTMGGYAGSEVQRWAKERGAAFLPVEKLEDCQEGCEELLASFLRWYAVHIRGWVPGGSPNARPNARPNTRANASKSQAISVG
jgi:hypothetical protein